MRDPDGNFVFMTIAIIGAALTAYDAYQTYEEAGGGQAGLEAAGKTIAQDAVITLATGGTGKLLHKGYKAIKKANAAKNAKGGTYKLKDADGVTQRTGRTNDLERRRKEHARNEETQDLDFEVDRRTDNPDAQRGREQIIYDENPQAQAKNGGLNKVRPISPSNPNKDKYMKAGEEL